MEENITSDEFYAGLTRDYDRESESVGKSRSRGVAPTLIVGLGGTGVEVVGRLKRRLRFHYRGYGQPADMIKFLIFDTVANNKQQNQLISQTFSETEDEYVNLATGFNAFAYLQQNYTKDKDLRRWWDNRYSVSPQYQEWGAKRVRQLGRLFLHHKHLQVESIIQTKVSETCTLYEELVRDQNLADVGSNFRVYITTSTCGGTGSGIFLDILYKIWRSVLSQGRIPEIRAFMFMPGIYEDEARKRSLELVQAHRANAYAFLKELDYFLSPQGDINQYVIDAKTRDPSQVISVPQGGLVKYAYLIDRQLGNLGNLDKPQDAYNLTADAAYQMIVTPVGQEEEGIGLTNIDTVVDPTHLREGKRTAYSSLGLSRILFPRSTLHAHLTYYFLRDLIFQGLTSAQSWMDEAVRRDERLKGLLSRLEKANLDAIDNFSRRILNLVSQCPTQSDLQSTDIKHRVDKITREKDLNNSRIVDGLSQIETGYRQLEKEVKEDAKNAVINLVNNCEFGVFYARKVLIAAKKAMRVQLEEARRRRHEYDKIKNESEQRINAALHSLEKITAKRAVPFKSSQANKRSVIIANDLRTLTESSLMAKVLEKKVAMLEMLVGQEQLVEERLANEEIVVERKIQKSLLDKEINYLGKLIDKLGHLGDRADAKGKDGRLAEEDVGVTITTQMFPPKVLNFLKSSQLRSAYFNKVNPSSIYQHTKTVLDRLNDSEEYHFDGLYQMAADINEVAVKRVMIAIAADYTRSLFKELLSRNVVEAALSSISEEKFADQVMSNLFELSQPCWNYDLQKANDPGMNELPRTYSLGYKDPDVLPIPEGRHQPGLVKTKNDNQITLLQAQHGLPLFALRVLPTLRADYKKYMRQAQESGSQPLHLNQTWTKDADALPDLKVAAAINDDVFKDFALGLFSDYLIMKSDEIAKNIIRKRPIDESSVRGYVYTTNGREYFTVKLSDHKDWLLKEEVETLASSGIADAAEAFANMPDASGQAEKFIVKLEQAKQYSLIKDLEEYLTKMIIPESKRAEDEDEKGVIEQEYTVLQKYLDELNYYQERGLPLAG